MPSRNRISANMTPTRTIDSPDAANGETLNFENARAVQALYVNDPQNLRRLEEKFGVKITTRDGWIKLDGPADGIAKARDVFQQLHLAREKGLYIRKNEFNFALESVAKNSETKLPDLHAARIQISAKKPPIIPKSLQQKKYVEAVKTHDLIFGIGPAGTGKTFLAMAMAVAALKNEEVTRIVLTRPAVEAGEALGFLPGDLQEKIFPYLRPLYDALNDMLENDEIQRYMDKGIIEIAPLAYMRGRTLSHCFVILDEAQNTTTEQMFMFLTRIGQDSKCVVTGDTSQVDLPHNKKSGLVEAMQALHGTEGIHFTKFDEVDVIRHELVQKIIRAYKAHRGEKTTSLTL
jgi:phosphate starvation-inducible protein PhoH and related proteins